MPDFNRREVLKLSGGAAAASALSGCLAGEPAAGDKPNIFYIVTDNHAAHAIGAYGGRLAALDPTPTLDRLAGEGRLLTSAFAGEAICTPSRATSLAGQDSQTAPPKLHQCLPADRLELAHAMRAAGYATAMVGAWHLREEPAAFDFYQVLVEQGDHLDHFDPAFRAQGDAPWPDNVITCEGHSSDCITDLSLEWLAARGSDQPFLLMHHFTAPHGLFAYAPRYEDYLADARIPEPDDLHRQPARRSSAAAVPETSTSASKRTARRILGKHMDFDPLPPDREYVHHAYQACLKAYLRCVKGVDDNIARLIAHLEESGQWDNTIVIYTSDPATMPGERDSIDKRWIYGESMHMPLIIRQPATLGQIIL